MPRVRIQGGESLLSVNGYDRITAGIFGGYAPDIPQSFRPGSQRDLRFQITPHPSSPDHRLLTWKGEDFTKPEGLLRFVRSDDHPVSVLLKSQQGKQLTKVTLDKELSAKARQRLQRELAKLFQRLTRDEGFRNMVPAVEASLQRRASAFLRDLYADYVTPLPPVATELFIIDCMGERLHPATYLLRDDWEVFLHETGKEYGRRALEAGIIPRVEFWNEPYLNWAERSRVNYNVKFYRQDLAVEGGAVSVRRESGELDIIPHLQWVPARDETVSQTPTGLMIIDTTAPSYWSGKGNGYIYDAMARAYFSGLKLGHPQAVAIAGWGFRWNEHAWKPWGILYQPTIDNLIDLIDGVHEHHYQGDPTNVLASYEVVTAYAVTKHNKWLRMYNTESNDLVDAPAVGAVNTPEKVAANQHYRRFVYNLRDILYAVSVLPDKAASRSLIHWNHTPKAIRDVFTFVKELRGRLVVTESSDPNVWVVSSLDTFAGRTTLTTIMFNNHRRPVTVQPTIGIPSGYRLIEREAQTWRQSPGRLELSLHTEDPGQSSWEIQGRLASKIVQTLEVVPDSKPATVFSWDQYFNAEFFQHISPDLSHEYVLTVPEDHLQRAEGAKLRVLLEGLRRNEGLVTVAGVDYQLPPALTRDNGLRLVDIPLAIDSIRQAQGNLSLRFATQGDKAAGYHLVKASLLLGHSVEDQAVEP